MYHQIGPLFEPLPTFMVALEIFQNLSQMTLFDFILYSMKIEAELTLVNILLI